MAAKPKTVERKIHFFKLHVPPKGDGTEVTFDVRKALAAIQKLQFGKKATDPKSRYADTSCGLMCAWPHVSGQKLRIELGRIRSEDLPLVLRNGDFVDLPIKVGDALVEPTHMQFFNKGIVGAEFNYYGPRATSYYHYCASRLAGTPLFRLQHLLRDDVANQLNHYLDLRAVTIRVHPAQADVLSEFGLGPMADLKVARSQNKIGTIGVILKSEPRKSLPAELLQRVKMMFAQSDAPIETFEAFQISGRTDVHGKVEPLNLLSDRFVEVVRVETLASVSRRVNSDHMYTEIEKAYNERKTALEKAASVSFT